MAKLASPTQYLEVTLPVIIIIVGVIFNTLAALIMLRRRFRHLSIGVYLLAMAILDTIFLLSNSQLARAVEVLSGVRVHALTAGGCKVARYLTLASRSMSAWVLVVLCGERLLALTVPHLAATLNTKRRAVTSTLTVVVLQGIIYTYTFHVYTVNEAGECDVTDSAHLKKHDVVINIFDFLNYSLVPSVIMATCNTLLVHLLCFSQQLRTDSGFLGMRSVVRTVVVTSFTFIALTSPLTIYQALIVAGIEIGARWIHPLLYSLDLLNHSINLVLYCRSGTNFFNEFKSLCTPCRGSCAGHSVSSVSCSASSNNSDKGACCLNRNLAMMEVKNTP